MINVFASDRGWLFEDLKQYFWRAGAEISEQPINTADAWIAIRTDEAHLTPDPKRTIVCVHDLWRHSPLTAYGGLILVHPEQRCWAGSNQTFMMRPIGALRAFTLRTALSPEFTVGWVGRDTRVGNSDNKRVDLFTDAMLRLWCKAPDVLAVMLGANLGRRAVELKHAGVPVRCLNREVHMQNDWPIEAYPAVYRTFDALVITSEFEAGPLCLFEALATGVPVVSTLCGWASKLIREGENGYIVPADHASIEDALSRIYTHRDRWLERREDIRKSMGGWWLEDWISDCLQFARLVVP